MGFLYKENFGRRGNKYSRTTRTLKDLEDLMIQKGKNVTNNGITQKLKNAVEDFIPETEMKGLEIVCYGLGPFSSSLNATFQLSALTQIVSLLSVKSVYIFDPSFSDLEKEYLREVCKFQTLSTDEKCLRQVSTPTVFFMPHCEIFMYENVLTANIDNLSKIWVIGNSFEQLKLKSKVIDEITNDILLQERTICPQFASNTVWNDTSFHSLGNLNVLEK